MNRLGSRRHEKKIQRAWDLATDAVWDGINLRASQGLPVTAGEDAAIQEEAITRLQARSIGIIGIIAIQFVPVVIAWIFRQLFSGAAKVDVWAWNHRCDEVLRGAGSHVSLATIEAGDRSRVRGLIERRARAIQEGPLAGDPSIGEILRAIAALLEAIAAIWDLFDND